MTGQPMAGEQPPASKKAVSEATIKITAVRGGYIVRDGKEVRVAGDGPAVAGMVAAFVINTWDEHQLGTMRGESGGADADHDAG